MGNAIAAVSRAISELGQGALADALRALDNASAGGGGSTPPVFYTTTGPTFTVPARAPLILVAVDTSGGNVDVALPANPQPGDLVRVKTTGTGLRPGTTSLSSAGGNTIDGGPAWPTGPVAINAFQAVNVMFQPNGVGGLPEWSVVSDYGGTRGGP
jgi:hypothetical protein